jgi:hypothetical protein
VPRRASGAIARATGVPIAEVSSGHARIEQQAPSARAPFKLALVASALCVLALNTFMLARPAFAQQSFDPERLNGVWLIDEARDELRTADGSPPPLLPEARRVYEQNKASRQSGDTYFDRATWCASPGLPRLALVGHPFEIIVNPLEVAFLYEWNRWARLVDMSGAEFEVLYPMSFGTATGHFDGDVLVIETRGLMHETVMDSAGMPHSDDLVMTERYRLLGDDVLENRIRFDDPETFAAPWETVVTYRRLDGARIQEDVCLDRIKQGQPAI